MRKGTGTVTQQEEEVQKPQFTVTSSDNANIIPNTSAVIVAPEGNTGQGMTTSVSSTSFTSLSSEPSNELFESEDSTEQISQVPVQQQMLLSPVGSTQAVPIQFIPAPLQPPVILTTLPPMQPPSSPFSYSFRLLSLSSNHSPAQRT